MGELVRVERGTPRPGCWRVVLDDPRHANALSPMMVAGLREALRTAFADQARAVVLDSDARCFCAGFDLRDIDGLADADLRARFEAVEELLESVRRAPALTVAIVRGAALGAGADLAAACDYRIGTPSARLAFPGSRFGVVLGTRHLAAVVGSAAALAILVEGRTLDADTALECALLTERCADDSVAPRIDEILQQSAAIDDETLRAILRLTRGSPSERDRVELVESVSRPGFASRVREHARRTREKRDRRRTASS